MNRFIMALTSLLLLLTSYQAFSFQNVDKLLADPNITWVGEVYADYLPDIIILDPVDPKTEKQYRTTDYNSFQILKLQNKAEDEWINNKLPNKLAHRLLNLKSINLNVYKDVDLSQKLSHEAYQKAVKHETIDTIITFDPETFEEIVQVVIRDLKVENVDQFRVKQMITYNAKTNQLHVIPVALAPIVINKGRDKKDILFWMPIKEAFKSINLDAASIDWAKRITKDIHCKEVKTIKGNGNLPSIFDKMLVHYRKHPSTAKLYYSYSNGLYPFKLKHIQTIGTSTDTIITFHPETFEEIIRVVNNSLDTEDLVKIRVYQDWVWDNKTQEMQVRLLGFGPVINRVDPSGHFPMFYIKARE